MPQVRPQGGDTGQEVDKVVGMFELLQVPASIECGIFHWVFYGEDAGAGYRAVPDQLRKGRNAGCCTKDMMGGAAAGAGEDLVCAVGREGVLHLVGRKVQVGIFHYLPDSVYLVSPVQFVDIK